MKMDIKNMFEEVYKEESDAIFRFCLVRVSSREQAMDITQETFLRFWQSLSLDKKILNNKAFLFTIARRLVIDWYRKKKSLSIEDIEEGGEEFVLPDEETSEKNLFAGVEGRYVLDKIKELPDSYREPLYFRFVEDLSPPEIAEILGVSVNAASVRINRGIIELRKIVADDEKRTKKNNER